MNQASTEQQSAEGTTRRSDESPIAGEPLGLRLVGAQVWPGAKPQHLRRLQTDEGRQRLSDVVAAGKPVWVQLRLDSESAGEPTQRWLEGSLDVWTSLPAPQIRWEGVEWISDLVSHSHGEVENDGYSADQLLGCLPYLYGRGIFRCAKDAFRGGDPPEGVLLFPVVGFCVAEPKPSGPPSASGPKRSDSDDNRLTTSRQPAPAFWALRSIVVVIGAAIISVRLPDYLCAGRQGLELDPREDCYETTSDEFRIPDRFFPQGQIDATEVAEGIAHHQAATARSASERLREMLVTIERRASEPGGSRHDERQRAQSQQELILDMTATVDQLDRQVSRLLRRFGSHGERRPEGSIRRLVPDETTLRYQFALDEIRSLRDDCQRAGEAINTRIAATDQDDRNRFELAAALLASLILGPTLVAGFFGANVDFPGHDSSRGFTALLLAVLAFVAAGVFLISVAWTHDWRRFSDRFNRPSFRYGAAFAAVALSIVTVLVAVHAI